MQINCNRKDKDNFFQPGRYLPGFLLWEVNNIWQRLISHKLSLIDLTPVQLYLISGLYKLSETDKEITQVELAHFTRMNSMMASNVLRTLEKKGLVIRIPHPKDTRANCLELTNLGEEVRLKGVELILEMSEKFFGSDKDETTRFVEYLRNIVEKYEECYRTET